MGLTPFPLSRQPLPGHPFRLLFSAYCLVPSAFLLGTILKLL
jgi:hypothetical protein